jgi:hypothetical protein
MAQIARCAHYANASIHGVERLPAQNDGRLSMKPGFAFAWTKQTSQISVSLPTPLCYNTELIRLVAVTMCLSCPCHTQLELKLKLASLVGQGERI